MTPEEHTAEALRLLADADKVIRREDVAEALAKAQIHATLATVRPTPPSPDLVDAALYYEAEREREIAVDHARQLRNALDEVRQALEQYGHWQDGDDIPGAVNRLIERVYNDMPEPDPNPTRTVVLLRDPDADEP